MTSAPEIRINRSLLKALRLFDADRLRWLDEAATLGPLVALRLGPVKMWVVTDPECARATLVTNASSWTRPPATLAPIRVGVGNNLFTQSDKAWSKAQPLVAPASRFGALKPRLADIDALVQEEVNAIPLDSDIDLESTMRRIALRLAAWVLLGEELDAARAEAIAEHQRAVVSWIGARLGQLTGLIPVALGSPGREMKRHRAALNAYADEVIARARRKPHADDVLGALLTARPSGRALSERELRGHVLGLFLAGNETTGAALSWALVHAADNPDQWAKVRDNPSDRTDPFIAESLRLRPAVWGIPRTPTKPGVTLASGPVTARVRRGQLANIYLRGINRDPTLWPDPMHFDPERHIGDTNNAEYKSARRSLLPFGLGPRGCIGQHLAMVELNAVIPALARRGDVAVDRVATEDAGFALRIGNGLRGRLVATDVATNQN